MDRRGARTRARGMLAELTAREWPHGHLSSPIALGLTIYGAGLLAYGNVDGGVVIGAGMLATLAGVLSVIGHYVRPLGILYAAVVGMLATLWIAYASGHKTANKVDAELFAALTLPLIVLYGQLWAGRRRTAAEAAALAAAEAATANRWERAMLDAGLKGLEFISHEATDYGYVLTMRMATNGSGLRQIRAATEGLERALETPWHGAITVELAGSTRDVRIHVRTRDALTEDLPMPDVHTATSIEWPIAIGVYADGATAQVALREVSVAVAGMRGQGKSSLITLLVAQLTRCTDEVVWMVDFKQGRAAAPWLAPFATGVADFPVIDWVARTADEVIAMLEALAAIGEARAASGAGGDKIHPSPQLPAIHLVLDEAADILAGRPMPGWTRQQTTRAAELVPMIVRKYRSEAIDIILGVQRMTTSMTGSRDLVTQLGMRMVFKVEDEVEAYNMLGGSKGIDLTALHTPGTFFLKDRAARAMEVKAYRLESEQIPRIAELHTPHRSSLDLLSAQAAGDAYTTRWATESARQLLAVAARGYGQGRFLAAHHRSPDDGQPTPTGSAPPPATPAPVPGPPQISILTGRPLLRVVKDTDDEPPAPQAPPGPAPSAPAASRPATAPARPVPTGRPVGDLSHVEAMIAALAHHPATGRTTAPTAAATPSATAASTVPPLLQAAHDAVAAAGGRMYIATLADALDRDAQALGVELNGMLKKVGVSRPGAGTLRVDGGPSKSGYDSDTLAEAIRRYHAGRTS